MKKLISTRISILLALLFAGSFSANAQWTDLGTFNQAISDLKSFSGKLWIGGNFTKVNGASSYWSTSYNGSNFALQNTLIGGTGINRFEIFNNALFASGGMNFGGNSGVAVWDGFTWAPEGDFTSSCTGIYADGNDLYVGSDFGEVFKKTGAGAYSALTPFGDNDKMAAFAKFNGQIIVAGQFTAVGGTTYNNIAAWNGSSWVTLGTGLSGRVRSLLVFNNELYAGGDFSQAGGQNAKYIAKWNGTAWSAVGGSVSVAGGNGIRDMVVANNRLYVAGDFTKIGNVTTRNVAFWNGTGWTGLDFTESTDFPNAIEAYGGEIYIGTLSFTASHLYRFDGTVATHEPATALQFDCAPNPVVDQFRVALTAPERSGATLILNIHDASGRLVLEDRAFRGAATYSGAAWPAGIYLVSLLDEAGQVVGRQQIVKQ